MCFSSSNKEGTFLMENLVTCFQVGRRKSESSSCICSFSCAFSSEQSVCQGDIFWGSMFWISSVPNAIVGQSWFISSVWTEQRLLPKGHSNPVNRSGPEPQTVTFFSVRFDARTAYSWIRSANLHTTESMTSVWSSGESRDCDPLGRCAHQDIAMIPTP